MKYPKINTHFFKNNRQRLNKDLKNQSLAIVMANDEMPRNGDTFFKYRQNSDFFYLTGIEQEKSILVLLPDNKNIDLKEVLFILRPNEDLKTWEGHKLSKQEATEISGIQNVLWLDEFDAVLNNWMLNAQNIYLNLNENNRFASEVPYRDYRLTLDLQKRYPLHKFERLAPLISKLRLIKKDDELLLIKKACMITKDAFGRVLKFAKPDIFEYEIEAEITHEFIRQGANGHAYEPIVASGENACVLHYIKNDMVCKEGDLILIDFGAEYANYAADCTRTIPVSGKFTQRQLDVYNCVLFILKETQKLIVPGTTINEYQQKVCKITEQELIRLGLLTAEEVKVQDADKPLYKKYFMHGVSHFMGLDVHDIGNKNIPLEKGMVVSCEPGIYIPQENIGIRLENTIYVDETPINLMSEIPIEPDEIEELMKKMP